MVQGLGFRVQGLGSKNGLEGPSAQTFRYASTAGFQTGFAGFLRGFAGFLRGFVSFRRGFVGFLRGLAGFLVGFEGHSR